MESRSQNQYLENRVEVVNQSENSGSGFTDLRRKCLDSYFEPKSFERWGNGRIYEWLGVRQFNKLYYRTFGKGCVDFRINLFSHTMLKGQEKHTRRLEKIHLIAGGAYIPLVALLYSLDTSPGGFVLGSLGVITNIAINIYPIMLQRYNRVRIQNILDKRDMKKSKNGKN